MIQLAGDDINTLISVSPIKKCYLLLYHRSLQEEKLKVDCALVGLHQIERYALSWLCNKNYINVFTR